MNQITTRADEADDLLNLLADQHRRSIIAYFRESSASDATLTELAKNVCERSEERVEQVEIQLHHVKLPQLAEAEIVEYDERSETIRYHGTDDVDRLMDCLEEL